MKTKPSVKWTPRLIRNGRLAKGWSQRELAAQISYSAMYVSHLENGIRPVPKRVQRAFDVLLPYGAKEPEIQRVNNKPLALFNRLPFNGMNSFDIAVANKLDEIIERLNFPNQN